METADLHIGIIMDGNRRWAKKEGLASFTGHKKGYENFKKIVKHAFKQRNIKALTFFAFSTENWRRSKKEVSYMMSLFNRALKELKKQEKKNKKYQIQVRFIGDLKRFPRKMQKEMYEIMKRTKENKKHYLNIALSYGGRDELVRAFKKIVAKKIQAQDISEDLIANYLDTAGIKDPDLIIRTSGEQRLSGFLTWQSVYSEIYFSEKFWPEFTAEDFDQILEWFLKRHRRFGQ